MKLLPIVAVIMAAIVVPATADAMGDCAKKKGGDSVINAIGKYCTAMGDNNVIPNCKSLSSPLQLLQQRCTGSKRR